jgi:nucleotide-binding universal stress UspA family protein
MIKTILVPASGSSTDKSVFATALAAAKPLAAHLDFYHVHLSVGEASVRAPHVDFCVGAALPMAFQVLTEEESGLSERAAAHFKDFCRSHTVEICDEPNCMRTVSASFLEEQGFARDRLTLHARHSDLVVLGRSSHVDYLPTRLIEDILMDCGRPLLIAPDYSPTTLTGTVVVGWKETPQCARALSAACPLLDRAQRVILLNIVERGSGIPGSLDHLAQRLKWHGISVETQSIASPASTLTSEVARAACDLHADLLVVGGFGHGRLCERLFGGVTQSLLQHANVPVFMMH